MTLVIGKTFRYYLGEPVGVIILFLKKFKEPKINLHLLIFLYIFWFLLPPKQTDMLHKYLIIEDVRPIGKINWLKLN